MKKFICNLSIYRFFDELIFIYPMYLFMMQDYGLNFFQISLLLSVWSMTTLVLEYPSGVIADKFCRKNILCFAQSMRCFGLFLWLLYPSFHGFLIGFIFWGISSAFNSGTFEALLYEHLDDHNQVHEFTRYSGYMNAIGLIGTFLAAMGATFTVTLGYSFALLVSIAALLISSSAIYFVPSKFSIEARNEQASLGFLLIPVESTNVFRLLLFISATLALMKTLEEYMPMLGENIGINHHQIGYFIAVLSGTQAMASSIAHRFKNLSIYRLYSMMFTNSLILITATLTLHSSSIYLLLVFFFIFKIFEIVIEGKIQKQIPNSMRATMGSIKNLLSEVVTIMLLLSFGYIVDQFSKKLAFIGLAILTFVIGFTVIFNAIGNHLFIQNPEDSDFKNALLKLFNITNHDTKKHAMKLPDLTHSCLNDLGFTCSPFFNRSYHALHRQTKQQKFYSEVKQTTKQNNLVRE